MMHQQNYYVDRSSDLVIENKATKGEFSMYTLPSGFSLIIMKEDVQGLTDQGIFDKFIYKMQTEFIELLGEPW